MNSPTQYLFSQNPSKPETSLMASSSARSSNTTQNVLLSLVEQDLSPDSSPSKLSSKPTSSFSVKPILIPPPGQYPTRKHMKKRSIFLSPNHTGQGVINTINIPIIDFNINKEDEIIENNNHIVSHQRRFKGEGEIVSSGRKEKVANEQQNLSSTMRFERLLDLKSFGELQDSLNVSIDPTFRSNEPEGVSLYYTERHEYYMDNKGKEPNSNPTSSKDVSQAELVKYKFLQSEESKLSSHFPSLNIIDSNTTVEQPRTSFNIGNIQHFSPNIKRKSQLEPVHENEAEDQVLESRENMNENHNQNRPYFLHNGTQSTNVQSPIPNHNEAVNFEQNDTIIPQPPIIVYLLPKVEARLMLQRSIPLFIALILVSIFTLLIISNDGSFRKLFIVVYCYLGYFVIERMFRICCGSNREEWRVREDIFFMIDGVCAIFLFACIDEKLSNVISISIIGLAPFTITVVAYFLMSTAPKAKKNERTLIKFYYVIQAFFFTAKIDGILEIEWKYIYGFVWTYFGVMAVYLIVFVSKLVVIIVFAALKRRLHDNNLNLPTELLGNLWYSLYYGLSIPGIISLLGINQAHTTQKGEFSYLRTAAILNLIVNIVLVIITMWTFQPLVKFMQTFYATTPNLTRISEISAPSITKKVSVNLVTEKTRSYFMKLSSTYFAPIDNSFFRKNEANIKRVKTLFQNLNLWKATIRGKEKLPRLEKNDVITIEILKNYKETLDKKFCETTMKSDPGLKPTRCLKERNFTAYNLSSRFEQDHASHKETGTQEQAQFEAEVKRYASAEDRYKTESKKQITDDENQCYLCFDNEPNAILMPCGHAGICYECAVALIKKKNECMECRKPVDVLHRIDPKLKFSDIVKGVEQSKVTLT